MYSIRPDGSGLTRLIAPTDVDRYYGSLSPVDGALAIVVAEELASFLVLPVSVASSRLRLAPL